MTIPKKLTTNTSDGLNPEIVVYNKSQLDIDQHICEQLMSIINSQLIASTNKIWHGHPVWFIDGNPIVGYSKLKKCVRLLFWSGQSFDESILTNEGSYKAAQLDFTSASQLNIEDLNRMLQKSIDIQWDYKNIVKRKGVLERLQ
jgi:hypothetical protein